VRIAELKRENPRAASRQRDSEVGVGFLRGAVRPPTTQLAYIDAPSRRFAVEPTCRVLQLSPSTYCAAKSQRPGFRRVRTCRGEEQAWLRHRPHRVSRREILNHIAAWQKPDVFTAELPAVSRSLR
jgi:hypothetical protein